MDGECIEMDACDGVECPTGQRCISGECQGDPCDGIQCPPGQTCAIRQETAQCVLDESEGPNTPASERDEEDEPESEDSGVGPLNEADMGLQVPSPSTMDGGLTPPPSSGPSASPNEGGDDTTQRVCLRCNRSE